MTKRYVSKITFTSFHPRKLDELFLKIRNGNKTNLSDIIIVSKTFYSKL